MIKFEFSLTRADHVAFDRIAKNGISRYRGLVIVFAFSLTAVTFAFLTEPVWEHFGKFQLVAQIGSIFMGLFLLRKFVVCWQEKRGEEEFSESMLAQSVTITFDENGLTSEQQYQKTIWSWSAFNKISTNAGNVYLWFGKMQAVMIPARSFDNDQSRTEFIEYVNAQIS